MNPKLTSSFLSPAEVELINRIAYLGYLFKRIQRFQAKYGGIGTKLALQLAYSNDNNNDKVDESMNSDGVGSEAAEGEEIHGVYIKAFCQGVNDILNVYKEHLLTIEHEYLRDRALTIS